MEPRRPNACLFLLVLLACAPALPSAGAQQLVPDVRVDVPGPPLVAGPNSTATADFRVTNQGDLPITVTLTVSQAPGWTTSIPEADRGPFTLDAGQARTIRFSAKASEEAVNSTVRLAAAATNDLGQDADEGRFMLVYAAPAPVPPPPPPPPPPGITPLEVGSIVVAAFAAGALLLWLLMALFAGRQVRVIASETQMRINRGANVIIPFEFENRSRRSQTVQIRLRNVHVPWAAAFASPRLLVAPKDRADYPMYVKVPLDAPLGTDHRIEVQTRPHALVPWRRRLSIGVTPIDVRVP